MPAGRYQELIVWQRAMDLVVAIYRLSARLPPEERFAVSAQLRRSAISIPCNIAEGHSRRSPAEYGRFVTIALASLSEVETLLAIVHRVWSSPSGDLGECMRLAGHVGRILRGLELHLRGRAGERR